MKFIKEREGGHRIEFEISNEATLDEVFEEFENFLRGAGYVIEYNKILDLVKRDE